MELAERQEDLLLDIDSKEKECLFKSDLQQVVINQLDYLISIDLVEFDQVDQAYYLTYYGYGKVEEIKEMIAVGETMATLEFQHQQKKQSRRYLLKVLVGILVIIAGYFAITIGYLNTAVKELDGEFLEEIKEDVSYQLDSLSNLKSTEIK